MKNISVIIITITILTASNLFSGTTYYVDAINGSNNNNGLSSNSAWRTLSRVNDYKFSQGDSILFKRGCVWREQLTISSSGTKENPLLFGAYSEGDKPAIYGSDQVTSWIPLSNELWLSVVTKKPNIIWRNDEKMTEVSTLDKLTNLNCWYWDAANSQIVVYSNGGISPNENNDTNSFEIGQREYCIVGIDKDYINIDGFECKYANSTGILIGLGSDSWIIKRCLISETWKTGLRVHGNKGANGRHTIQSNIIDQSGYTAPNTLDASGIGLDGVDTATISNNIVKNSFRANMCIFSGTTSNITIEHNVFHDPGRGGDHAYGLQLYSDTSNDQDNIVIRYNYIYDCGHANIYIINRVTNSQIYYNLLANGGSSGSGDYLANIALNGNSYSATNIRIYNNVMYQPSCNHSNRANIRIPSTMRMENALIKNNIFYNGNTHFTGYTYHCDSSHITPPKLNNNCHYSAHANNIILYEGTKYTWSAIPVAVEQSGQNADPLMIDIVKGDFHLQPSSPCINIGADVSLKQDFDGNRVPYGLGVDIGAFEYISGNPLYSEIDASASSGYIPLNINFIGSAIGGTPPYGYRWDFGDGKSSSEQNPSHTFTSPGDYSVRLIVTDSRAYKASDTKVIKALSVSSESQLIIITATGKPAPAQGGTTNPQHGSYTYPNGSSVQIEAKPNQNYRFSKWIGDVSVSDIGKPRIFITMNRDKSISGLFCTKCGDVNGDLNISPLDAQLAFDIFLGRLAYPTGCQEENADVNSDGYQLEPLVTPADAQAIFFKYLGKDELPSDCSCNSRNPQISMLEFSEFQNENRNNQEINIIIDDITGNIREIISVSIIIDNPYNLSSFGFDITFPSEELRFIRVEKTDLAKDYFQVDGYEIQDGILRIGGYSSEPINTSSPGELVKLLFRATKETKQPKTFFINNTYDDLQNAFFNTGSVIINESDRNKKNRKEIIR